MGVAVYKLRNGSSGDWYSWDGDMLHLPVLLGDGVGTTLETVIDTTDHTLGTTDFANLVTYIKANQVTHAGEFCETVVASAGITADIAAFVAAVT